jgi:hypothetical protein
LGDKEQKPASPETDFVEFVLSIGVDDSILVGRSKKKEILVSA